jgi:hypothetical protein
VRVTEPDSIALTYTPTLDEWEHRAEAWSRATGATRRRLVWGWSCIVLAGLSLGLLVLRLMDGVLDFAGLMILVLCAGYGFGLLTDVAGRWARRRHMRQSPGALLPSSAIVRPDGVFMGTAISSVTLTWDFWKSVLVLEDCLILATDTRWTANWAFLPRRGLQDPERWDDLVRRITCSVPVHPRSALLAQRAV